MKIPVITILVGIVALLGLEGLRAQEEGAIGQVNGVLFIDSNGNGQFDEGEELPPDVVITLVKILEDGKREIVSTSLSIGEDGTFGFGDLPQGTYVLAFDFGGGVKIETQSFQITPENSSVSLVLPVNAAAVGNYVFSTYTSDDGTQLPYRNPSTVLGDEVSGFAP